MKTQINSAIIAAFQNLLNPNEWQRMKDAFINEGYKSVSIKPTVFKNLPEVEIKTSIYFSDHEPLVSFLANEHKLAMESQDFEWAAQVHERQKNLNPDINTFEHSALKFSVVNKDKGVCEVPFETNVLSFKNKFVEEFLSFGKMVRNLGFYEFSEFWNDFICKNIPPHEISKLWQSDKEWTKTVLSDKLRKSLSEEFNLNNKLWFEWKKFDLIAGTDDHFEGIYVYDLYETFEKYLQNRKNKNFLTYPKHQLLLLEHENDFRTALNELMKLTYERAKTKVLITYPYTIKNRIALITNTLKILDQSDKDLPEYSTEYILVLGEHIDDILYWSFYQFGCNGVLLNSHFFTYTGKYKTIENLTPYNFEDHPIWQDFKTVEINVSENSIKWINAVKPSKEGDNTIVHLSEIIAEQDYGEDYYVSCKFSKGEKEYLGYVHLSTDYDFRKDGDFDKYIEPVIFEPNTNKQVRLTINNKKQITRLLEQLKVSPDEFFPLNYEIHAKLEGKGFKTNGILNY